MLIIDVLDGYATDSAIRVILIDGSKSDPVTSFANAMTRKKSHDHQDRESDFQAAVQARKGKRCRSL